jgi:unsaturated rhamnogalacturonyl hydrolase
MRLRGVAVAVAAIGSMLVGPMVIGAPALAAPPAPVPPPTRAQVVEAMRLADTYWIANGPDQAANNWQNAMFNMANLAYVTVYGKTNGYTLPWSRANRFLLPTDPARPFLGENYATGEAYLDLYKFHPVPETLAALRDRVAAQTASVQAGDTREWDHVEAVGLAMPAFARLAAMDNKPEYLDAMQKLFRYAERRLYNDERGLWWRDSTAACTHTYWSRGNGLVLAGLVKVLAALPAGDPRRPAYTRIVTRMAASLARLQRSDGFWNVDLTNRRDHPGPETAGTALIAYGIANAVNQGILPAARYRPVVERAWHGLVTTAERADGLIGYVQGPATKPSDSQPVGPTDTAAYGVAAFLLAGSQLAALET